MPSGSRSDSEGGEHLTPAQLHLQSPGVCKSILYILLPPSCPGLHCFPPLPNASHRFCTEGRRQSEPQKPQEASNKRLLQLDADGEPQALSLFPNHCYLLSCADPAAQPHPWQVLVPKSLFAPKEPKELLHGHTKPRSPQPPWSPRARRAPRGEGDGAKVPGSARQPHGRAGAPRGEHHQGQGGGSPVPSVPPRCHQGPLERLRALPGLGLGQGGAPSTPQRTAGKDGTWDAAGPARGSKIRSFLSW